MSTREFSSIVSRVAQMCSISVDERDMVKDLVNEAYIDCYRDMMIFAQRYTLTLNSGQSDYDMSELAEDFLAIDPSTGDSGDAEQGILRFLPDTQDLAAANTTFTYALSGLNMLTVTPVPTADASIEGWMIPRPVPLVDDQDVARMPSEYVRGLVYRSVQLVLEWDAQDVAEISSWEGKYQLMVNAALKERKRVIRPAPLRASRQLQRGGPSAWYRKLPLGEV